MADKPKAKSKAKPASKPKKEAKPATAAVGKAPKKAAKAAAGKSAKKSKPAATAPAEAETYYVSFALVPAEIHDAPPPAASFAEFGSFDDARERLLEHLIEMIDLLEHRLHAVRRIGSFDEYRGLFR